MRKSDSMPHDTVHEAPRPIVELGKMFLEARSLEGLGRSVIPELARFIQSNLVFLFIADPRLTDPRFFQLGFQPVAVTEIETLCAEQFKLFSSQSCRSQVSVPSSPAWEISACIALYPLRADDRCVGLAGWATHEDDPLPLSELMVSLLGLLSNGIDILVEREQSAKQLAQLNAYLTVSSMLAQSLDLHELLEIALYCCMELVSAEEASVLLLGTDKKDFRIYHVEGPAKLSLEGETFPADVGLAGFVLQTKKAEVINDVQRDPRFYKRMDLTFGFPTRNMIAIPLIAGEEKVGVLEVLNKANDALFTQEERLLLLSISEEIAFAIRNAMVFEYVVNTYCKQRQGQLSCKGCKRPLGSWTPCVKYREASI